MSGQYPHCIRLTSIKNLPVVPWGIANAELELFLLSWAGTTILGNSFVPVVRLSCPPPPVGGAKKGGKAFCVYARGRKINNARPAVRRAGGLLPTLVSCVRS